MSQFPAPYLAGLCVTFATAGILPDSGPHHLCNPVVRH